MIREKQYKIGKATGIIINRNEANFDRACDSAYDLALMRFGSDDMGYLTNVEGFERSTDSIEIGFLSYIRIHHDHTYEFYAKVVREDYE